jgi:hypothetical protein
MDIRERIKNVIVKNLIEARLSENEDPTDSHKYHDILQANAQRKVRNAQGPRTRKETLGTPPGRGETEITNQAPDAGDVHSMGVRKGDGNAGEKRLAAKTRAAATAHAKFMANLAKRNPN